MDKLTTIANSQKERTKTKYYRLMQGKTVVAEHSAPSYLNWYKGKYNIVGGVIIGVR